MSLVNRTQQNEWVAPYSIEECGHRLMALHQKFSLFSFGSANRTTVKIKVIDNFRYQFEIRRVQSRSWIDTFAPFAIKGELVMQSPTATQVSYRVEPNWLMIAGVGLYMIFFLLIFALIADLTLLICFLPIILFTLFFSIFFMGWRLNYLKNQLRDSLGGKVSAY